MQKVIFTVLLLGFGLSDAMAQFYLSPQIGFKVYGLNGAETLNAGGQVSQLGVADAGGIAFNVGTGVGYELTFPGSIYRLDLQSDLSWSSINFVQKGFDSNQGSGAFAAAGMTGGGAEIFSLDLMPVHRFVIPKFPVSPFGGLGLALNLYDNTNITGGPPDFNAGTTISGETDFQVGLLIFYGAYLDLNPQIQPFIQFKHLIPFAGSYQMTSSETDPGAGTSTAVFTMQDAPGHFNIDAGVRFDF